MHTMTTKNILKHVCVCYFNVAIHFSLYFDNIDNKRAKQRQKELAGTRPNKKSDLKENLPEGKKGQSRYKIA